MPRSTYFENTPMLPVMSALARPGASREEPARENDSNVESFLFMSPISSSIIERRLSQATYAVGQTRVALFETSACVCSALVVGLLRLFGVGKCEEGVGFDGLESWGLLRCEMRGLYCVL